jgi:hypothetical protein
MHTLKHKEIEIDVCPACKSVWLALGESEILDKTKEEEESSWYDGIDPLSAVVDIFSSDKGSSCSGADNAVLDTLGEIVGGLIDGI